MNDENQERLKKKKVKVVVDSKVLRGLIDRPSCPGAVWEPLL
jgi:hypothetical protein